ncbi:MAG: MFS transporter [Armatimonadota bacterium]|nr:MFS transporter [Armatimonadota bacterium]MDR7443939.1 MFS transporter [Armatimonadota bacterium]MDR7570037.1 MFS transporter [Armatimonadota bacterium]MDR7613203.1 MFS transporter [Armatimonadota bacterium]
MTSPVPPSRTQPVRFVVLLGVVSLLADATYEGARSILGPYLLALGATATAVGFVSGLGELVGYVLRLVSGKVADRTRRYWALTAGGYTVNLLSVPLLAVVGRWEMAGLLVLTERAGKALRTPPRDAMLSYAASRLGAGWAFGLHEALDQAGAVAGPLLVSGVLAAGWGHRDAFAALALPAVLCLAALARAYREFPEPSRLQEAAAPADGGLARALRPYLVGVALVAAGFVDFPLLAYHFSRTSALPPAAVPVVYALAMAADAAAAVILGRWFDRWGMPVLAVGSAASAAFAPLAIFGGPGGAVVGAAVWGAGVGLQESVLRAAVARLAPPDRRAFAFGLFQTVYGVAWFGGSALLGLLYDLHPGALVAFAVATQVAAALRFAWLPRRR